MLIPTHPADGTILSKPDLSRADSKGSLEPVRPQGLPLQDLRPKGIEILEEVIKERDHLLYSVIIKED